MGLNFREAVGLLLVVAGLVLVPVAWAFSRLLWLLAALLFAAGAMLFFTERRMKRELALEKEIGGSSRSGNGTPMPSDIHNYTGWRSGGRSGTMDSSTDSGSGDGD